jgi:hypothetical protein
VTDVMATQFQLPFEVIERSKEGFTIGIAAWNMVAPKKEPLAWLFLI